MLRTRFATHVKNFDEDVQKRYYACMKELRPHIASSGYGNVTYGLQNVNEQDSITVMVDGTLPPEIETVLKGTAERHGFPFFSSSQIVKTLPLIDDDWTIPLLESLRPRIRTILRAATSEYGYTVHNTTKGLVLCVYAEMEDVYDEQMRSLAEGVGWRYQRLAPIEWFEAEKQLTSIEYEPVPLGFKQSVLQPGVSIGLLNNGGGSTGTAGCFVQDEQGGKYLLTASHCVMSNAEKSDLRTSKTGVLTNTNNVEIRHPAYFDGVVTRKLVEDLIAESGVDGGEDYVDELTDLKRRLTGPTLVGSTILRVVSYGNCPIDAENVLPCRLDYALVKLPAALAASNAVDFRWGAPRKISGNFGSIRVGMVVFKRGRTTASTQGTVTSVKLETEVPSKPGMSSEWIVKGKGDVAFCRKGDSGSGVWNVGGDLVGILWGSDAEGNGYVTPIEDIMASVLSITGMTMSVLTTNDVDKLKEIRPWRSVTFSQEEGAAIQRGTEKETLEG